MMAIVAWNTMQTASKLDMVYVIYYNRIYLFGSELPEITRSVAAVAAAWGRGGSRQASAN